MVKAFYDATDTVLQLFRVIQGLASQRGQKKRHIAASREARIIPKIALESPVTAIFV